MIVMKDVKLYLCPKVAKNMNSMEYKVLNISDITQP